MRASARVGRTSSACTRRIAGSNLRSSPTEDDQRIPVYGPEPAQRGKRLTVAAVRRRGEQHDVRGSSGNRGDRGLTIAVAGRAVRFVDDEDVPGSCEQRGEHFRPFDVIDGSDGDSPDRPGVHSQRQGCRKAPQGRSIREMRLEPEADRELLHPLIAQAGGRDDENTVGNTPCSQFGDDDACLDGLTEADFVGQQYARTEATNDGQCRLELVRHDVDAGVSHGSQRSGRRVVGKEGAAGAPPCARRRETRARVGGEHVDIVEGREHLSLDDAVRRRAGQRDELTILVRANVNDAPARSADANPLRDLHRVSASAGQSLPRRSERGL